MLGACKWQGMFFVSMVYEDDELTNFNLVCSQFCLVLLEAMACGTPVVASNIPGNPEVVQSAAAGQVVVANTPECFADAIRAVYATRPSRAVTRAYAEEFSWDATSAGQLEVFRGVLRA